MGNIRNWLELKFMGPLKYARKIGVKIGSQSRLVDMPNFGSEPYLITIGKHVLISFDVTFITHDASTFVFREKEGYKNIYKFGPIVVGDNCFIGAKTIILPNVKIGNDCIIGAGSLVNRDVPSGEVWAGVPARRISTTIEYAEKCKKHKLPYDDELINTNKKEEMLRVVTVGRIDNAGN